MILFFTHELLFGNKIRITKHMPISIKRYTPLKSEKKLTKWTATQSISFCISFTWFNGVRYVDVHIVTVIFRSRSCLINDHICVQSFTSYDLTRKIDSSHHLIGIQINDQNFRWTCHLKVFKRSRNT